MDKFCSSALQGNVLPETKDPVNILIYIWLIIYRPPNTLTVVVPTGGGKLSCATSSSRPAMLCRLCQCCGLITYSWTRRSTVVSMQFISTKMLKNKSGPLTSARDIIILSIDATDNVFFKPKSNFCKDFWREKFGGSGRMAPYIAWARMTRAHWPLASVNIYGPPAL